MMICFRVAYSFGEETKFVFFSDLQEALDYIQYVFDQSGTFLSLVPVKVMQSFIDPGTLQFDIESIYHDDPEEDDCGCVVGQEECKKCENTECTLNERFEY